MQVIEKIQPVNVNTNVSLLKAKPNDATFLKNYRIAAGRDKTGQQGGNSSIGKKFQSNWLAIPLDKPAGINKTVLFFEHEALNEAYLGNWNSEGNHTLYILYGNTLTSEIVKQGPEFEWTLDPRNFIAEHRAYVRIIYDISDTEERHIREKILIFTDGSGWQRWINVLSAIATKGYNATLFPYYELKAPHFDANELIDYPVRPPMFCPVITALPRTDADKGLQNHMLNKSIQFASRYIMTDGRSTTLSPHSNPFFVRKSTCGTTKTLTRSVNIALYVGSPHVERMQLFVKLCGGDWMLYDTIDKFDSEGDNAPDVIGDNYWLRTSPWKNYSYDPIGNTINYVYSGDREVALFNVEDAIAFQNDVPIKSYSLTAAGDALLWFNNLLGYDNLPTETTSKFSLEVSPSQSAVGACAIKNQKIVLYAYVARDSYLSQPVYSSHTGSVIKFGGVKRRKAYGDGPALIDWIATESDMFGLTFGDNQNFICYLAGTPYSAEGVQYKVNTDGTMDKLGLLDFYNNEHRVLIQDTYQAGGYFVQRFEFNVPAGHYLARLSHHGASLSTDYQKTSTYVQGIFDHTKLFGGSGDFLTDPCTNFAGDFFVDTTGGDVDFWGKGEDMFYIFAPAVLAAPGGYRFIDGYVYEDTDSKFPVEVLKYTMHYGHDKREGYVTDHNGFFFSYVRGTSNSEVDFFGYFKCNYNVKMFTTSVLKEQARGTFLNQIVTIKDHYDADTAINTRTVITGKVVNADSGLGIPGIGVTMHNGPTYFTDGNGVFTYNARTYFSTDRTDLIYFNGGGECVFIGPDCAPLVPIPFSTAGLPCSPDAPRIGPSDIVIKVRPIEQSGKGLKGGGRYGIGGVGIDLAGRPQYVQDLGYIDIPTFMETGVFAPSQIKWNLTGALKLPAFVKYFTFFRTSNLSALQYIQWVGDKIDYIDLKGNIVPDGNGAIRARITIKSLLDFNIESNFNTNVSYQFVQGDIMRVMDDGEMNLFAPADNDGFIDCQVLGTNYNQTLDAELSNQSTVSNAEQTNPDGSVVKTTTTTTTNPVNATDDGVSFIVEYDERLLALKDKTGFWIELIRPRDLQQVEGYCEAVGTVVVKDGEPVITSGILDTFDTYYQTRNIKIPNALGKSQGHPFESASVTDFSSSNCSSCGRKLVKDPLAKQTWHEDDSIKTDDIINEGRVNGLGRVREKNRKNFKGQSFGGIVAAHAERNRILLICERDWVTCDYDMNYIKVTSQGLIQANLDSNLSDPYPKEGSNFGCAYEDTGTIVFYDGTSVWYDRFNSAVIALDYHHNQSAVPVGYRNAVDITEDDVKSYFINKTNYLLNFNASLSKEDYLYNLMEVIAGLDPQTGEYNITFRPRNGLKPHPQYFVNDEREIFYDLAETFIYNPDLKKWVSFAGYAPEFYGKLSNSISGVELITFAAGDPWFHNSNGKKGAMNFYGVQTNQVIEVPMNISEDTVKLFQNVAVLSADTKYFVDRVITQNPNFFSLIPLSHFKKEDKIWYASFKNNMGTYPNPLKPVPSLLMDGAKTVSKVALVRFVSEPEKAAEYGELNGINYKVIANGKTETK